MKEEKRKVGRPKLADKGLKKRSIIMLSISLLLLCIFICSAVLTFNTNATKLSGVADKVVTMRNGKKFQYYTQWGRYTKFCGRNTTIGYAGCGTTSMAMVLTNITGNKKYTPEYTMREAYKKRYCGSGISGTDYHYFKYSAEKHGLKHVSIPKTKEGARKVQEILRNGGYVIANVTSRSKMTKSTHFVVIYDIDSKGNVYVANPNSQGVIKRSYGPYSDFVKKGYLYHGWWGIYSTKTSTTTTKAKTTTKNNTTTKASSGTKECKITYIASGKNSNILKYKVGCAGGATISDTKYQVPGESMISRDSDKRKVKVGKIIFRDSRKGKSVKLRVYYNNNQKYDEKSIVLGSGKKLTETLTTTTKSENTTTTKAVTTTKATTTTTKTTTTKDYSTNSSTTGTVTSSVIETYSVVNVGAEPNACYIRILANNGKTIKYQVLCQANGRPLSVKLAEGNSETYILKDFKNHKGYVGTHTYTFKKAPSQKALLRLTYKKMQRTGDENDTKYIAARSIYENGTYKIDGNEVAKINTSKIPTDKCTISVSNVKTNSFKWTVKCNQGARPISVRLTETYNGRAGSQIKGLPHGYDSKYGITKSEVSKSYVSKGSDYTLVLYFGTKQKDYYKTTVSFTTPMTNITATTKK